MNVYYRAEEAMKKLGLPKSTFHYLVRQGKIPKIILPLRKQAVYPVKEIDEIAQERAVLLAYEEVQEEGASPPSGEKG
jgi:predicted DNA-binding transcriptional regulator AlpA